MKPVHTEDEQGSSWTGLGVELAERGLLPDFLLRRAMRDLCAKRLADESAGVPEVKKEAFILDMKDSPLALVPEKANEQHYEVPPEFFERSLGRRLKYSGCLFEAADSTLDQAEEAMLALSCLRAQLVDGMDILELGCGWGSLTLWMAEKYPKSKIMAVSNSRPQREFIERRAAGKGLTNLMVRTADMNDFDPGRKFDRVVSVEMFEHMRNYELLFKRIASWLDDDGKLFAHVFAHKTLAYPFETEGDDNWMGRHFFTGGLMPSFDLFRRFDKDLKVAEDWWVDGTHYARTAEAWLANTDAHAGEIRKVFSRVYGPAEAARWLQRWRMFYMACAELFGYDEGREWGVAHYLFTKA